MKIYVLQAFCWEIEEIRRNLFFKSWDEQNGNTFKYKPQFFTSYATCSCTKSRGNPSSQSQKFRLLEGEGGMECGLIKIIPKAEDTQYYFTHKVHNVSRTVSCHQHVTLISIFCIFCKSKMMMVSSTESNGNTGDLIAQFHPFLPSFPLNPPPVSSVLHTKNSSTILHQEGFSNLKKGEKL